MKKSKTIIVLFICVFLVLSFAACKKNTKPASAEPTTQATTTAAEVTAAAVPVKSEDISFYDAKDAKGNILKLSPIYAKDGKTVVAAYIISASDKNNKALDSKAYPLLNSVVASTSNEKGISLTYDSAKKLIKIESYADENGNIIALRDVNDINKNKNTTEFIKLTKKTNEKGSVHYLLSDEILEIKKEGEKTVAIDKKTNKKTVVEKVDSKNDKVKKTVEKDTASQTEKKEIEKEQAKEKANSPDKGSGSGSSSDSSKTDDKNPAVNEEKVYIDILLKKNGAAECSSAKVETKTNEVVINEPGDYKITSQTDTWHGSIKVKLKNDEEAELRFEDVNISYNKGNIIQLIDESDPSDRSFIETEASAGTVADDAIEELSERTSAPNVDLTFPTGTKSRFENTANVYTGVIYNESKLTIKGNGKAVFKADVNANNVISTSKSITIKNVDLSLETAATGVTSKLGGAKGIFSYAKVNVESGSLSINANGDGIRCDEYNQTGGSVDIVSSACDGIDADDLIVIEGGTTKVKALEKTSLKVRRVNNQDRYDSLIAAGEKESSLAPLKKNSLREGKDDGFKINGGTVRCESYKVSTPRKSKQKSVLCKASKQTKGNDDESKKPVKWKIEGVASSENSSVKFLYSSSSVVNKEYKILADGKEKDTTWKWADNVGVAKVVSSTTV